MGMVSVCDRWEEDPGTPAQRKSPGHAAQQDAYDVVPVEKLKGPAWSQFEGVCPRPPADHAEHHEGELNGISFRQEGDGASLIRSQEEQPLCFEAAPSRVR